MFATLFTNQSSNPRLARTYGARSTRVLIFFSCDNCTIIVAPSDDPAALIVSQDGCSSSYDFFVSAYQSFHVVFCNSLAFVPCPLMSGAIIVAFVFSWIAGARYENSEGEEPYPCISNQHVVLPLMYIASVPFIFSRVSLSHTVSRESMLDDCKNPVVL